MKNFAIFWSRTGWKIAYSVIVVTGIILLFAIFG